MLIEAPTGSGKTEARCIWPTRAQGEQQRGLYVAMPTMATSNQMHERVGVCWTSAYGTGAVAPLSYTARRAGLLTGRPRSRFVR